MTCQVDKDSDVMSSGQVITDLKVSVGGCPGVPPSVVRVSHYVGINCLHCQSFHTLEVVILKIMVIIMFTFSFFPPYAIPPSDINLPSVPGI